MQNWYSLVTLIKSLMFENLFIKLDFILWFSVLGWLKDPNEFFYVKLQCIFGTNLSPNRPYIRHSILQLFSMTWIEIIYVST